MITAKYTRLLKKGMSGDDVRYMKEMLFAMKYYKSTIKKIGNSTFGSDTLEAVKKYQASNKDTNGKALKVDGIVGQLTWNAIERDYKKLTAPITPPPVPTQPEETNYVDYAHILPAKRVAINKDLQNVSSLRVQICVEALSYAYDADVPGDIRALYMIGQNLYNTNLTLNTVTETKIHACADRSPTFYSGGREQMMVDAIKKNPHLTSADCSGQEVGFLRKYKLVKNTFDATANTLCGNTHSTAVSISALKPGDWVGKDGHIGLYVGGGYAVEFMGGAYGCQLTKLTARKGYNFVTKRIEKMSGWTKFRRPKYY